MWLSKSDKLCIAMEEIGRLHQQLSDAEATIAQMQKSAGKALSARMDKHKAKRDAMTARLIKEMQ